MEKKIVAARRAPVNHGMGPHVRQVIPSATGDLDPFVFLDHFGPMDKRPGSPGIPAHPHAGIATITYLFAGSNRHQDSYGHDAVVRAGDVGWMTAGKGIVHSEGMHEVRTAPETVHGLQLWISLPAKDKFAEPGFFHYPKDQIPVIIRQEATVRVLCGSLWGHTSPVQSTSPAFIFEVELAAGHSLELPVPEGYTGGAYVISGQVDADGMRLGPAVMAKYTRKGEAISLKAETDAHLILLGGQPLDEPIVGYASYVMNSEEQIRQVMRDYAAGKMGVLED